MERSAFLGSYVRETRIGNAGPLGTACEPKSKIYETLNESPFFVVRGISSRGATSLGSARCSARSSHFFELLGGSKLDILFRA